MIDQLSSRILDDSPKCLTMTFSDAENDIYWTVILLSEQSNDCLVGGLLESFGVHASDLDTETLASICVLYEGRRLGLRDRESLSKESSKLRAGCLTKIGSKNGAGGIPLHLALARQAIPQYSYPVVLPIKSMTYVP